MLAGNSPDALVAPALYFGALSLEISGREAVVTCIQRTADEQLDIVEVVNVQRKAEGRVPWLLTRKSVHQYHRGEDFRSWIYTEVEREELIKRVNRRFNYGRNLKVLAYHTNGTAGHLHMQIPAGRAWRMP